MASHAFSLFDLEDGLRKQSPERGVAAAGRRMIVRRPGPPAGSNPVRAQGFDNGAPIQVKTRASFASAADIWAPQLGRSLAIPGTPPVHVEPFELDGDASDAPVLSVESEDTGSGRLHFESQDDEEPERSDKEDDDGAISRHDADEMGSRTVRATAKPPDPRLLAVEQDLRALRDRQYAPSGAVEEEPMRESTALQAPADNRDHSVFERMAKGLTFATHYEMPPVNLKSVFAGFDQRLDAEAARRRTVAAASAPRSEDWMPDDQDLARDLAALRQTCSVPEPASTEGGLAGASEATPREFKLEQASEPRIDIRYDVQLVPQLTGFSCWAAGAAMLVGWHDRMSIDPSEIAKANGYWRQYANGLDAEDVGMFQTWGLTAEPAQSYAVEGLADLLRRRGPLWVASAEPGPHVRVVTGMVGDGTPDGTIVYINDPWETGMVHFRLPNHGAQYTETYQQFVDKQESLARTEMHVQGIYVAHL